MGQSPTVSKKTPLSYSITASVLPQTLTADFNAIQKAENEFENKSNPSPKSNPKLSPNS